MNLCLQFNPVDSDLDRHPYEPSTKEARLTIEMWNDPGSLSGIEVVGELTAQKSDERFGCTCRACMLFSLDVSSNAIPFFGEASNLNIWFVMTDHPIDVSLE